MAIDFVKTSTQYINCASGATLDNIFDGGGSIVFWMHPHDFGTTLAMPWSKGSAKNYIGIRDDDVAFFDAIYLQIDWTTTDGIWQCDNDITLNVWQHIAITYNDDATTNDPIIYVNAVAKTIDVEQTPVGTYVSDAANNWLIGVDGGLAYDYDGLLEDFRAFSRILSQEEVSLLAAGYRGPLGGEAGWWSMNEARALLTPGTLTQGTHLLSDLSANSNDGDPYGDAVLVASDCPRMGVVV